MVLGDVVGRPDALARLRAVGAVGPTTDVIAVHLDHDARRARSWTGGSRRRGAGGAGRDDADVGRVPRVPDLPRRTLVLGGARSGKSVEAERRLESFPEVVYVATGGTRGGRHRVGVPGGLHRERRPACLADDGDLRAGPAAGGGRAAAADRLSVAVADGRDGPGRGLGRRGVGGRRREGAAGAGAELVAAVRATRRTVVAVTNEVGSGIVPGDRVRAGASATSWGG